MLYILFLFCIPFNLFSEQIIELGVDRIFEQSFVGLFAGKKIGLITNHTGVNKTLTPTSLLFLENQKKHHFSLIAFFSPEHGLHGEGYANEKIALTTFKGIPVFSLFGDTRRPTKEMLKGIDLLVFDIQDIGSRSYTFASTLYYALEEAAKNNITVIVLDRPNPINGVLCDGPLLEDNFRSFVGYANVPYCHGMTIGELARFFVGEYKLSSQLIIVPMKGWKRWMSFKDTGLIWVPTSPYIPEASTALFYPITGLLGEIGMASVGIGYTLPFKVIGAPWIDGPAFVEELTKEDLPGVSFYPWKFRPFASSFNGMTCSGALIVVHDEKLFLPIKTSFLLMSTLKKMYPKEVLNRLNESESRKNMFYKVCGTKKIFDILKGYVSPFKKLSTLYQGELEQFKEKRKQYLIKEYE